MNERLLNGKEDMKKKVCLLRVCNTSSPSSCNLCEFIAGSCHVLDGFVVHMGIGEHLVPVASVIPPLGNHGLSLKCRFYVSQSTDIIQYGKHLKSMAESGTHHFCQYSRTQLQTKKCGNVYRHE